MSSLNSAHAALDAALRKRNIYDRAREVLRAYAASQLGGTPAVPSALPSDVFDALAQAGLVDALLAAAREEGVSLDAATFELLRRAPSPSPSHVGGPAGGAAADVHAEDAGVNADARGVADAAAPEPPLDPNRRYLRVTVGRGRAFLTHLEPCEWDDDDDDDNVGEGGGGGSGGGDAASTHGVDEARPPTAAATADRFYVLHLCASGQRFRSAPARASVEPLFSGGGGTSFLIDVTPDDGSASTAALPSLESLLRNSSAGGAAVHFTLSLITSKTQGGRVDTGSDVIGSAAVDWRSVLGEPDGCASVLIPLLPPSPPPGLPAPRADGTAPVEGAGTAVGLLPVSLTLIPAPGGGALAKTAISKQLALDASRAADAASAFLAYSKAW